MNANQHLDDAGLQRGRKRLVALTLIVMVVTAIGAAAAWALRHARVQAEDRTELPWSEHEAALGSIDLARLFSEELPAAFAAPDDDATRQLALDAVASDETLHEALVELLTARRELPLEQAMIREEQVVDEINAYLETVDRPWALRLPIDPRMRASAGFALSYFVDTTVEVVVDDARVPVRFASRVDGLNVLDAMLGHADDTRRDAFLVIDRAAEAAADRLWPLMDPARDAELSGHDAALAPMVRDEAARHAAPGALDGLVRTAGARAQMVAVGHDIDRRAACGARISLARLPLRGFPREDLASWRSLASPGGGRACPDITFEELRVLDETSATLRATPGLRAGVRSLTALVARSIAIHEAQHVRDFDRTPVCRDCPPGLGDSGESELSAWLAAWAWSDAPYTELLLTCDLLRGRDSATRRAVVVALESVGYPGCEGPVPADLSAEAARARAEWFGEAAAIAVPETFPRAVRSRWF